MRQESFYSCDICIGEPILLDDCHAFVIESLTVIFVSNVASHLRYCDMLRLCSECSCELTLWRKKYMRFFIPLSVLRFVLEVRAETPVGRDVNCISL
jgi:hypothetical protein